jgi:hypothetical protein
MPVRTFRDNDAGYESWLTANPSGWVVNARRSPSPSYMKLHRAECPTISRLQAGYSRWTTGDYIKVCAEHRAELDDWAQRTFSAELQDGCHCVQYGSRARSRTHRAPVQTRGLAPTPVAAPVVTDAEGYGTIETAGLIPFEPRDAAALGARAALRSILGGLSARPGELLYGIVEGPAVSGTDLDNALLYNVGGDVNRAVRYGVALERRATTPGAPTRYRYRLTSDPDVPALDGERIITFNSVPLDRAPRTWIDVWAAIRTSDAVEVEGSAPAGEIGMRLSVGAPRFAGAANAQFVKTVVDGVMTALHAHRDRDSAAVVADRLAAASVLPARTIAALMINDDRAALGTCQRLVVLRGQGVQCHPQDGRISTLRIELDRAARSWGISGCLIRVNPV